MSGRLESFERNIFGAGLAKEFIPEDVSFRRENPNSRRVPARRVNYGARIATRVIPGST